MHCDGSRLPDLAATVSFGSLGDVCRLGLASRGNTHLPYQAVERAIARGINYLNWCGYPDGLSEAIRRLGSRRSEVRVAVQLEARSEQAAQSELERLCAELATDYLDVVTYYYVEHEDEWRQIVGPGGAAHAIEQARAAGRVRAIGLTSHQRTLAARWAQTGRLDCLMIRYNAAHRGAEREVFPVARQRQMPLVAFTPMRWGALLRPTPADPPGLVLPTADECYRFVLAEPAVSVVLTAPDTPSELDENLRILENWRGLSAERTTALRQHGDRVRRYAGAFP